MPRAKPIPLARIIDIAEFRASLRSFLRHNERACQLWNLTPQRFQLLLAIKGSPDGSEQSSVTGLAERLQLSRNSVTELCTRAEEAGLLERISSPDDKRVVFLRLTREGERLLFGVLNEADDCRPELLAAFDALATTLRTAAR